MTTQKIADQSRTLAAAITAAPVDTLLKNPSAWGTFNLEECREDLERIFELSQPFVSLRSEKLPNDNATNLRNVLNQCKNCVDKIKNFNIESVNPADFKNQIRSEIAQAANALFHMQRRTSHFFHISKEISLAHLQISRQI